VPAGVKVLCPWRRMVRPPRPRISTVAAERSKIAPVCIVDAEDSRLLGKLTLELGQAAFTEVAVAGVVRSALGVVVVRYDGDGQVHVCEEVGPGQPVRSCADFVDLVDR